MDEKLQEFINITDLDPTEARIYVEWGKGNLELALNYFYSKQEKMKKSIPPVNKKQSTQSNPDAFCELRQGSQKQFQLQQMIKSLKEEYNKPIDEQLKLNKIQPKRSVEVEKASLNYLSDILINTDNKQIKPELITQNNVKTNVKEIVSLKEKKSDIVRNVEMGGNGENLTKISEEQPNQKLIGKRLEFSEQSKSPEKNTLDISFPLLLGRCTLKTYSSQNQNMSELERGTQMQMKIELFTSKNGKQKQKSQKQNEQKEDIIIRVYHNEREVARLEKKFEDVLGPLLRKNYIKVETYYEYSEKICRTFETILVNVDVFLLQSILSDPDKIIDTGDIDEDQKIFQDTREACFQLFQLMNLQLLEPTMINFEKHQKKIQNSKFDPNIQQEQKEVKQGVMKSSDPFQKQPVQLTLNIYNVTKSEPQQLNISRLKQEEKCQITDENEVTNTNDVDYTKLLNLQQCQNDELKYYDPPTSFISKLYDYQKQALTWMLAREGVIKQEKDDAFRILHPLWQRYLIQANGTHLYFNPFSGQVSIKLPRSTQRCKGGILADEMGLGKTIMLLALIHSNPAANFDSRKRQNNISSSSVMQKKINPKVKTMDNFVKTVKLKEARTLIIVPLTLISQWEQESRTHSLDGSLTVCIYYGTDRYGGELSKFDIVLTTYGTVSHEFTNTQKKENKRNSLFDYNWFRIILDEAHYIKGRTIQIAQAVYNLNGYYRWCSTGTPIQNQLNDLFSLLHFIKLEPWSDYQWWNTYINKPYEKGITTVFEMLQQIINPILLRRTKKSKTKDGNYIISLPNKEMQYHLIDFTEYEVLIYQKMEQKSQEEVQGFLSRGVLLSQYMKVFELILRLRQVCDHPFLILTRSDVKNIDQLEETISNFLAQRKLRKIQKYEETEDHIEMVINEENNDEIRVHIQNKTNVPENQLDMDQIRKYKEALIQKIHDNELGECPVCLEKIEDAIFTSCLHILCRLCINGVLANQHQCPICRSYLSKDDFMTLPRESDFSMIDWKESYTRSSKIGKILQILEEQVLPKNDKCVIFTQFLGMIEMLQLDFDKQHIKYLRLDGKLSQQQRANVIRLFNEDPSYQVFIISLKAGGVGLNLTTANHVMIVDPWWYLNTLFNYSQLRNPAVEDQAIERIYRIGQTKDVFVHRLIMKNSIEERIIEMHKHKRQLFDNTITTNEEKKEIRIQLMRNLLQV